MHVLHIIQGRRLYPQAQQAIQLISEQLSRNIRVSVICEPDCVVAIAAQAVGAPVAPFSTEGLSSIKQIIQLRTAVRNIGADLVHVHCDSGDGLIPGIAARLAGRPRVLSSDSPRRFNRLPRILGRNLYNQYLIAFEDIEQRYLKRHIPTGKISQIRIGVTPSHYQPTWSRQKFLRQLDLETDQFLVGILMDFSSAKERGHLLKLLPLLTASYVHTRLVIFGDGPGRDPLEKGLAALEQEQNVRFAGARSDSHSFLGHFDLMLNLGAGQERALGLLEAQAAGVAIAGFDVPGYEQLVAEHNRQNLVSAKDFESLASVVQRLVYRPRERRALSERTSQWIRTEFAMPDMAVSYLEAYARVLWKSGSSIRASCEAA